MKVLFITRKYPPSIGGMETFSAALAREFWTDMDVIAWGGRQVHIVWWLPLTLIRAVWRARRYDVVHCGDGVVALIGVMIRWLSRRPVSVTVHGLDIVYHHFFYQRYIWWALRYFDRVMCVSAATAKIVQSHWPSAPVVIIPNGITVADWPLQQQPPAKQLLTVGRLVPRKGVAWFVAEVMPQLPSDITYHIIGHGPELAHIQQIIAQKQLGERVRLRGHVADAELKLAYLASAVLIMPNITQPNDVEGFGIVALEAGAVGVPVIAARLEGIPDAIIDGVSGILVESRSVSAWLAALQRVLEHSPFTAAAIRSAVQRRFSWSVVAASYREQFKQLRTSSHG